MGMPDSRTITSLPPRGISTTRARIGPDEYLLYTHLCDNRECYAVAYGKTEDSVLTQLRGHVCPAPMRRDMHPSGSTSIQKIWHELDETIDGIKAEPEHSDDLTTESSLLQEKAYASALAFTLAIMLNGWYRSREDVLIQANKRWKMRQGTLPFEPTPGYNYYPAHPLAYAKREDLAKKATPARKSVSSKRAPIMPVKSLTREFSVAERHTILELAKTGTPIGDLAQVYNVTPERIKSMIPNENETDTLMGFMFQ